MDPQIIKSRPIQQHILLPHHGIDEEKKHPHLRHKNMNDNNEPECQLRRRRVSGNPSLHLEVGFQIDEGNPDDGTPSPGKAYPGTSKRNSAAFQDFKNKQQSFDIQTYQKSRKIWKYFTYCRTRFTSNIAIKTRPESIEECEEEEIIMDSDEEEPDENVASGISRAVTPTPIQDFGASVTHLEGSPSTDFLRVKTIDNDCYTDVSEDEEDEE